MKCRGFSLTEMVIGFVIMGVVLGGILHTLSALKDVSNRTSLYFQQQKWEEVLTDIQDKYYNQLVENDAGLITVGNGTTVTLNTGFDTTNHTCQTSLPGTKELVNDLGYDNSLLFDPWGGRWCLIVSRMIQDKNINGLTLKLRNIAALSEGKKRGFQNHAVKLTLLTCPVVAHSDSRVLCNNGIKIAEKKLNLTYERLNSLSAKLESYAKSRVRNNPGGAQRNYYFVVSASVHVTGAITTTLHYTPHKTCSGTNSTRLANAATLQSQAQEHGDIYNLSLTMFFDTGCANKTGSIITTDQLNSVRDIIGISAQDVVDGFGGTLRFDNASGHTRNPFNSNLHTRTPPFNARVLAELPGGTAGNKIILDKYIGSY